MFLFTLNVNIARFARNVEFFFEAQQSYFCRISARVLSREMKNGGQLWVRVSGADCQCC